jgi:hypothetical protein
MFRTSAVILALALLPSLSSAQGRRDRGARDNSDSIARAMPSGPKLNSRDIEGISPMRFLLDKRKDLKLTDDQQKQIKDADGKLKEKNAAMLKQVDSLVREMKPGGMMQSAEDEARVVIARDALRKVIGEIRVNYDAGLKEMLTKLDEAQNTTVQSLLPKQQQENADMLRERLGSRSGGGAGGRRGF